MPAFLLRRCQFQIQQAFRLHDDFILVVTEGEPATGQAIADGLENVANGFAVLQGFMSKTGLAVSHTVNPHYRFFNDYPETSVL